MIAGNLSRMRNSYSLGERARKKNLASSKELPSNRSATPGEIC